MFCKSDIRYLVILLVNNFYENVLYITQDISFITVLGTATVQVCPSRCRIFFAMQVPQDVQQYVILLWPKVIPFAV